MRRQIPRAGTTRMIKRFLWYPVRIGEDWRWLERAVLKQLYDKGHWSTIKFADNELLNLMSAMYQPGQTLTETQALEAFEAGMDVQWKAHPGSLYVTGWRNVLQDHVYGSNAQYRIAP